MEGIEVETVLINDEISAFPPERAEERRGTTADHLVIHVAGAAAASGMSMEQLQVLLKRTVFNCRSLGVSTAGCKVPETGLATFELPEGRMEFGMGIHGEAGVEQVDLMTADATAERLCDSILADLPYLEGDDVVVLVNGYGATTRMEMFILMRRIHQILGSKGITVHDSQLGEFCTAQEMAGVSVTLMKLDDEIKKYWDMPAHSPGFSKQ